MTRSFWVRTLNEFSANGTPTEQRLAQLSLELIFHPQQVEYILDRTAKEILDVD